MPVQYLVTGGAGFIGAALVRTLVERGERVTVLDDGSRGSFPRLAAVADHIEVVRADIRDGDAVRRAARGSERLIHLAHVNGTELFYREPERVLDVGIRGILNVIDACRTASVRDLLVASSSEVYHVPPSIPTDESAPLVIPDVHNPRYSYAGSKIATELLALHAGRRTCDRVVVFRPHNVYGPDMGTEHVIPQLTLRAAALAERTPEGPLPLEIQGDGSQTRAFMYIDDCAQAIAHLCEHGHDGTVYHVGNPEETSIGHLARMICSELGREVDLLHGPAAPGSPTRRCPDVSRLRATGFDPATPLRVGLPPTVSWYLAQRPRHRASVGT